MHVLVDLVKTLGIGPPDKSALYFQVYQIAVNPLASGIENLICLRGMHVDYNLQFCYIAIHYDKYQAFKMKTGIA